MSEIATTTIEVVDVPTEPSFRKDARIEYEAPEIKFCCSLPNLCEEHRTLFIGMMAKAVVGTGR